MTDRNKLIDLLCKAPLGFKTFENQYYKSTISKIADHLIANGVILSPVDIGKTVYKVSRIGKIVSLNVVNYDCDVITSPYDLISFNSFGKTVFLTREEAEKKLKEREV